jgi:uncharacterized protein YbcV (DUF1398 family)
MQRYTISFTTVSAIHVSGGFFAHHQELKIKNCTHSIWYVLSLLAATGFSAHHQELKIQNCTHSIWYV